MDAKEVVLLEGGKNSKQTSKEVKINLRERVYGKRFQSKKVYHRLKGGDVQRFKVLKDGDQHLEADRREEQHLEEVVRGGEQT